jgi:hypothetical protein
MGAVYVTHETDDADAVVEQFSRYCAVRAAT